MSISDKQEREPSLQELLADPVVHAVMKADGLEARDLIELVLAVSRNWRAAQPSPRAQKAEAKPSCV